MGAINRGRSRTSSSGRGIISTNVSASSTCTSSRRSSSTTTLPYPTQRVHVPTSEELSKYLGPNSVYYTFTWTICARPSTQNRNAQIPKL